MLGSIIGDIIGSSYEFHNVKTKDFQLFTGRSCFTDDTILTCATADYLLNHLKPDEALYKWGKLYQDRCYENGQVAAFGKGFTQWLETGTAIQSKSNGCIMRLSPFSIRLNQFDQALEDAISLTKITHNHPESINATKAYLETMWLVGQNKDNILIKKQISEKYHYNLFQSVDEIRAGYDKFYVSCQHTVPEAIICALDANSYEDAIRNAVSLGGDSDTLACMTGGIAEMRHQIPGKIKEKARRYLDKRQLNLIQQFYQNGNSR